jgi:hypothetical protein
MPTEAGTKMQKGISAVCRMHSAVSKLIVDFDKNVPWSSTSVFGNFATKDLTYHTKASYWMPEGVFRYLSSKADPKLVEAITVCFIDSRLVEPLLLIGRLEYADDPIQVRSLCDGWDLWNLYFEWNKDWQERVPMNCKIAPEAASRIRAATLVAAPLYSVTSMNDVVELMKRAREA